MDWNGFGDKKTKKCVCVFSIKIKRKQYSYTISISKKDIITFAHLATPHVYWQTFCLAHWQPSTFASILLCCQQMSCVATCQLVISILKNDIISIWQFGNVARLPMLFAASYTILILQKEIIYITHLATPHICWQQ